MSDLLTVSVMGVGLGNGKLCATDLPTLTLVKYFHFTGGDT